KKAKQAYHSAERSIKHTAKHVAHEVAHAEKSIAKTVHHVAGQVEHAAKNAEKSVEHTAKHVAHEVAHAEKSVAKTVHHVAGQVEHAAKNVEKLVEHTAKNVAHEVAHAEQSVTKTVHHVVGQVEHAAKNVEKSVAKTAKNVAKAVINAEKQVAKTVKNTEQTAKQIKTAISKYKESMVAFGKGAGDAALSDVTFNTVNNNPNSKHPVAYKAGDMVGHAVTTLAGTIETVTSIAAGVGGITLDATGVGAIAGVPAGAVAAAGVTQGISMATKGTSGLVQSGKDLYNLAVHNEGKAVKSTKGTGKTQIQKNKAAGDAYEQEELNKMNKTHKAVQQQITIKTQSGVKTRIDIVGKNKQTGELECVECKASPTAPLTKNQKQAFPEIEKTGATVVGKGKPPYTGGTQIPPTKIEVRRKS
ncbi:hypothetical protein, partial [Neobacillus niacini]|uniref:hypothetical protein n=1 Tax=Neobacillus niacini TaxID=86668 RepID=UPI002863170C